MRPSGEKLDELRDEVARRTAALSDGSLRPDLSKLDDGEARELFELTTSETALSEKQRARWEYLVERGAAREGLFARLRDFDAIQREARELHRGIARRPFTRKEERGLFAELADQIEGGFLNAEHVAVVAMLLISFQSAKPFGKKQRFDVVGGESVLVIDANWGLISDSLDDVGMFARWRQILEHLERNAWVTVERRGPEWSIRLGVRATRALGGGKAKAA